MCYKILIIIACIFISPAFSQKKIDRQYFITLLQNRSYGRVFDECTSMRNGVYGKCAILDYFIAKSLCSDGYQQKSDEWLKYIMDNYPLKDATRKFIKDDIAHCTGNSSLSLGSILTLPLPQAGVSGMSKLGPIYNCSDKSQLITWENLISEDELQSRLFSPTDKEKAVTKIQSDAGATYRVSAGSQFIIVTKTSENISDRQVESVITGLQKAFEFYKKFYSLRAPDKFLTVYLMPDQKSLHEVALKIHGINVGSGTLGYSLLADLSLLGISDPGHIGTLYHELFHLVIRTDAGDIPAWLDEGLASLYSVYKWDNDVLKGMDITWRQLQLTNDYLSKAEIDLPKLAELVSYNWREFNGGDSINLCKASVNYALSNHFLIFLQEKGLLQNLVAQFKTRNAPGGKNDSASLTNISIIERTFNSSIDTIQLNFEKWFVQKYHFILYRKQATNEANVEYQYTIIYGLRPKIESMLSYIASQPQKENNRAFLDSAKNALKVIDDKHGKLSYGDKEEGFNKLKELNKQLFDLYNKAQAINDRLKRKE